MREIAQNSEFTHGVVHYYFADKVELITTCVRLYKTQCVNRFDEIVVSSQGADELLDRFADKLVETMTTEAPLHRLWYDLRTQSLFEDSFRDDVLEIDRTLQDMIWRVVARYAELSGVTPLLDPQAAYAHVRRPLREGAARAACPATHEAARGSRSACTGCFRRSARPHPTRPPEYPHRTRAPRRVTWPHDLPGRSFLDSRADRSLIARLPLRVRGFFMSP